MFQKMMILTATLVTNAAVAAPRAPWAHYKLQFKPGKPRHQYQYEVHVGQCDDAYFGGFTVAVPGVANLDFKMSRYGLDRDCTFKGSKQEILGGRPHTIFFIEGRCNGTIEFMDRNQNKIWIESSDAC